MENKKITYFLAAICIVLGLLQWRSCNKQESLEDINSLYEALQATLVTYKDQDSLNHGKIEALYGSIANLKSLRVSDSSEIGRLKKLVNKKTISATIFSSSTSGTINGATTVLAPSISSHSVDSGDTIYVYKCDPDCYPIYTMKRSNKWENMDVTASKDSICVKYLVFNDYAQVNKFEKQGKWPFKKSVLMSDINNYNPHTTTTALKTFVVELPKPHRERCVGAGLVVGVIATLFLTK